MKVHFQLSERTSCGLAGLSRTAYRCKPIPDKNGALRARLKVLTIQYPRYGLPILHNLLKSEGLVVNKKRTERLYNEENLQVRTKKRKKLQRPDLW